MSNDTLTRPPAAGRPTARRWLLWTGVTLAVLAVANVAVEVAQVFGRHSVSSTQLLPGLDPHSIRFDSGGCTGNLTVVGEPDGQDVGIDWHDHWSFRRPTHHVTTSGDDLVIRVGCPLEPGWSSSVDAVLRVPAGARLVGGTDSGRLRVTGLTGGLRVHDDSGRVDLTDVGGDVVVDADSGDVDLRGAGSLAAVRISTDSGSVQADLPSVPRSVQVHADSGDVGVRLPRGPSYAVDVHTDSGSRHVGVAQDSRSGIPVSVHTDSGSVRVGYV